MINIQSDILLNRNAFFLNTINNTDITKSKNLPDIQYSQSTNSQKLLHKDLSTNIQSDISGNSQVSTFKNTSVLVEQPVSDYSKLTTLSDVLEFHTRRFSGGEELL